MTVTLQTTHDSIVPYIAIEGVIGVGKTTLCQKLSARFNQQMVLEKPQDNPFLTNFYKNPKKYALQTQLSFLMQRVQQLQALTQQDLFSTTRNKGVVADYIMQKDYLFAELILKPEEFALYDSIYQHMTTQLKKPDLVIYLQASLATLKERIKKRDRNYEKRINLSYLAQLHNAYMRFFHDYMETPIIIVNTETINIVDNEADLQQLIDFILANPRGRHYFNPTSLNTY